MRKLLIVLIAIAILSIGIICVRKIMYRYEYTSADISEFAEKYDLTDTLHMNKDHIDYIEEDFTYRNWDSNYEFKGSYEEVLLSLAKNVDGQYVIFAVPRNRKINVLVLNEFPFPSRDQLKAAVYKYNNDENGDIDTGHLERSENYPRIEVANFYHTLEDEVEFGTLFMVYVGPNNDTGNIVYVGIDSNGNYVFLDCERHLEHMDLIYNFDLKEWLPM